MKNDTFLAPAAPGAVDDGPEFASQAAAQADPEARTQAILAATTAFLNSLNADQHAEVRFPFAPLETASAAEFRRGRMTFVGEKFGQSLWSNFPVSDVPRPGLALGTLSVPQRCAALRLLQALLSPKGCRKVIDIMDSDQALSESGTPYDAGTAYYTLGIFGTPSADTPWMLQFGGHHLALNAVVAGSNVSLTPMLTGCHPATFIRDGHTVRPLAGENDKALRLMDTFSPAQRQKSTLNDQINNLVQGPGQGSLTLPPAGLPASEMTEAQRVLLLDLIDEWSGMLHPEIAAPKRTHIRDSLSRTYFAWYGETSNAGPMYFRIAGPTVHIEFAHQHWGSQASGVQAGGVNHIHTGYRDPTNDYGRGFTVR